MFVIAKLLVVDWSRTTSPSMQSKY